MHKRQGGIIRAYFIPVVLLVLLLRVALNYDNTVSAIIEKYDAPLQKIFDIQKEIADLHPFLKSVHPIAILDTESFYVFDTDSGGTKYRFILETAPPFPVSEGIRASFPLSFYKNKPGCIVSAEIFDSIDGYSIIFHEFMHCQQMQMCEQKIKESLTVYQTAMAAQDYMWELNFPFPYQDSTFSDTYSKFIKSMISADHRKITVYRAEIKRILSQENFEYLCWQEWKEGFARLIENKIRKRLKLKVNNYGMDPPYHRISFYYSGEKYIQFLADQEVNLLIDIESLFRIMLNAG